MAEELCKNCGAPRAAGYAACKYCSTPFVENTQTGAIQCPTCKTLNELGLQRCVQCQAWVVVQCVFCHAISPYNIPACHGCGEAFAGAPERFAARQREQHLQQGLQIAGTVGNVAASFLGAAAGAGLFSGNHGYEHHHHDYAAPNEWNGASGGGIAQTSDAGGGGFFDSLLGGGSDTSTGANIAQSDSGGGFLDSVVGSGSDDDDA
jgi:hypothetical protein